MSTPKAVRQRMATIWQSLKQLDGDLEAIGYARDGGMRTLIRGLSEIMTRLCDDFDDEERQAAQQAGATPQ